MEEDYLTPAEYEQAKTRIRTEKLDPEELTALQEAVDAVDARATQAQLPAGAQGVVDPQGRTYDTGGNRVAPAQMVPPDPTEALNALDPNQSLLAPAANTIPSVAGPAGEAPDPKRYFQEKMVKAGDGEGTAFYYEMPLSAVKERIFKQPELIKQVYRNQAGIVTPEQIQNLPDNDPLIEYVRNLDWAETADAAMQGEKGMSLYRYSKHDWLQGEGALERLGSVFTGVRGFTGGIQGDDRAPLDQAVVSFVGGGDKTATFGAVRKAVGAISPEAGKVFDESAEEQPVMHGAGQVAGIFPKWSAGNAIFDAVAKGTRRIAPNAGGAARLALGGAGGVVAGGLYEVGQEAVNQAANAIDPRAEATLDPEGVLNRSQWPAMLGGGFGVAGEALSQAAGATARNIGGVSTRPGSGRFRGIPQQLEDAGHLSIHPVRGVEYPPEIQDVINRSVKNGHSPRAQAALDIQQPVLDEVLRLGKEAEVTVGKNKQTFYPTEEGQQLLPMENVLSENVKQLDSLVGEPNQARGLEFVDKELGKQLTQTLNADVVGGVAVGPANGRGGVSISPEKAALYLPAHQKRKLVRDAMTRAPTPGKPGSHDGGGAPGRDPREIDPADLSVDVQPGGDAPVEEFGDRTGLLSLADDVSIPAGRGKPRTAQDPHSFDKKQLSKTPEVDGELTLSPRFNPDAYPDYAPGKKPRTKVGKPGDVGGDGEALEPIRDGEPAKQGGRALTGRSDTVRARTNAGKADNFAVEMRRRGISEITLYPKQWNAQQTDQFIDTTLESWRSMRKEETVPPQYVALDAAARKDRDARTMNGQPGGWSAQQEKHSDIIATAKALKGRVAGHGDRAQQEVQVQSMLKNYGTEGQNAVHTNAIRQAADSAGIRPKLEIAPNVEKIQKLQNATSGPGSTAVGNSATRSAFSGRAYSDAAAIRAYPTLKRLGAPTSGLAGGRAGVAGTLAPEGESQQELTMKPTFLPPELNKKPLADPAVQQYLADQRKRLGVSP